MKIRRRTAVVLLVLAGYAATWLIAPRMAKNACMDRARRIYSQGLKQEEEQKQMLKELGEDPNDFRPRVHATGPRVRTGVAFPILPSILVLQNSYSIGRLWGKGQISFFLFYGFGVCRLFEFTTWIS